MSILTGVSIFDRSATVKVNVIVLCNTHTREMLLSLPAAAAAHCSSAAPLPLQCCTSATGLIM